ncbi:MAG: hypothetical protein WAW73_09470 [Rhodoferax sp.]
MNQADIPIFPTDLMRLLGITHANTLRLKIKSGQVPEPDVRLTQKTRYWHRATLVKAGLLMDQKPEQVAA